MEFDIKVGLKYKVEKTISHNDTAKHYGSGLVPVFATPAMIALMENASMNCVLPYLPEGFNTVGTEVSIKHLKATPVGKKVECEAELIEVDRKKLLFSVTATDKNGIIGKGTHTRFIIDIKNFMNAVNV